MINEIISQFTVALTLVGERALEILRQPAINKEMLWILLPSIVALFLMELYFGRYTKEELGWNSAVGNALVLFFVGMNLASWLYAHKMLPGLITVESSMFDIALKKTFIAAFVLAESALLLFLNFFHLVTKRFAFGISSALIINFVGVMSIVLVYSDMVIDIVTFPALLLIFICMAVFFWFLQALEPKITKTEDEEEDEKVEKE